MTDMNQEQTLDRKDLKILAYKERVSELNEANADLRVEVTFLSHQLQEAQSQLASLQGGQQDGPAEDDDGSSEEA